MPPDDAVRATFAEYCHAIEPRSGEPAMEKPEFFFFAHKLMFADETAQKQQVASVSGESLGEFVVVDRI
ncbi:MAG: hypothetical protein ACK4UV_12280, partial [Ignavibacterium sp.]